MFPDSLGCVANRLLLFRHWSCGHLSLELEHWDGELSAEELDLCLGGVCCVGLLKGLKIGLAVVLQVSSGGEKEAKGVPRVPGRWIPALKHRGCFSIRLGVFELGFSVAKPDPCGGAEQAVTALPSVSKSCGCRAAL